MAETYVPFLDAKVAALPQTLRPDTKYWVADPNDARYMELHLTNSTGSATRTLKTGGNSNFSMQQMVAQESGQNIMPMPVGGTSVALVAINGLIQPVGSFSYSSAQITFPASLSVIAGDTLSALVIF